MRDIPMFTCEFGAASLFLREIPYRGRAHIRLQSSQEPEKLLRECISFCRMCGAEWIDAAGDPILEGYPKLATLQEMHCPIQKLSHGDVTLEPVTEQTVSRWLQLYNTRMADVPNAAYMDSKDGVQLCKEGSGYFVMQHGELVGIGKAGGDFLDVVIALQPGMGETVVRALTQVLSEPTVRLWVADTNVRAVRLYERLGFEKVRTLSTWYRVL